MAGEWIRIDQAIGRNSRVLKARRLLGVSKPEMVGLLVLLWAELAHEVPSGELDGIDADTLAEWAGWEKDGATLMTGLAPLIDGNKFAGWEEYQGARLEYMEKERKRKADWRARQAGRHTDTPESDDAASDDSAQEVPGTSPGQDGDVRRNGTVRDGTEREKEPEQHTPPPAAVSEGVPDADYDAAKREAERALLALLGDEYREAALEFLSRVAHAARYPWVQRIEGCFSKYGYTRDEVGEALQDIQTHDRAITGPTFLRACCQRIRREQQQREEDARKAAEREGRALASVARAASHERDSTRVAAERSQLADAQQMVSRIRAMAVTNSAQGGTSQYIRLQDIAEQLGADVAAAYLAAGGQERFLKTPGDKIGILHRDFVTALEGARRTNTKVGAA